MATTSLPVESPFLTIPEVADLLRISRERAYQMAAAGGIPCIRLSERRLRVPRAAFEAWIQAQTDRAMEGFDE